MIYWLMSGIYWTDLLKPFSIRTTPSTKGDKICFLLAMSLKFAIMCENGEFRVIYGMDDFLKELSFFRKMPIFSLCSLIVFNKLLLGIPSVTYYKRRLWWQKDS